MPEWLLNLYTPKKIMPNKFYNSAEQISSYQYAPVDAFSDEYLWSQVNRNRLMIVTMWFMI